MKTNYAFIINNNGTIIRVNKNTYLHFKRIAEKSNNVKAIFKTKSYDSKPKP
jgi:hypothetical protein